MQKSQEDYGIAKDDPVDYITDSNSFILKARIIGRTSAEGNTKNFEIAAPLKHLSSFWGTLEMLQINCEINFTLTWSEKWVITNSTSEGRDVTFYVSVADLSAQDNTKLLQ